VFNIGYVCTALITLDLSRGEFGSASLITTIITWLIWAYRKLLIPMIRMLINSRAPQLSTTFKWVWDWIIFFFWICYFNGMGKKEILFVQNKTKGKKLVIFFPNKGFFLLVQHSYLKIMNWVCMDILVAAIEIAFLAIFMLPRPFCKSFYLVQWQLPNIRKIPSPNSSMFPRILG
jgi:hypothetical protein